MSTNLDVALAECRQQMARVRYLYGLDEVKRLEKWEDEQAMLQSFVFALEETQGLIRDEIKRVKSLVTTLRADTIEDECKLGYRTGDDGGDSLSKASSKMISVEVELARLQSIVKRMDEQCDSAKTLYFDNTTRSTERQVWEAQIITLQDTKRLYLNEIEALEQELHSLDRFVHVERQRRKAQLSGWSDLTRLQRQLSVAEANMDSAKQKLYFPAAKGFRFAGGSSKIYVGAKDLDVEEISGSFLLTAETECSLDPVCGEPTAHLTLTLGGASMLGFERQAHVRQPEPQKVRSGAAGAEAADPLDGHGCQAPPSAGANDAPGAILAESSQKPVSDEDEDTPISRNPIKGTASDTTNIAGGGEGDGNSPSNNGPVSPNSHASSTILEECSARLGDNGQSEVVLEHVEEKRGPGFKGRLNNIALKLSKKARQPLKNRFQAKQGSGAENKTNAARAGQQADEAKLGRKFNASVLAGKVGSVSQAVGGIRGRLQTPQRGRIQDLRGLSAAISQRAAEEMQTRIASSAAAAVAEVDSNSRDALSKGGGGASFQSLACTDEEARPRASDTGYSSSAETVATGAAPEEEGARSDAEAISQASGWLHADPCRDLESSLGSRIFVTENTRTEDGMPAASEVVGTEGDYASDASALGGILAAISSPICAPRPKADERNGESEAAAGKTPARAEPRYSSRIRGPSSSRVAPFEQRGERRRGVYVMIRADGMQLVGEKGTKVPNTTVKEILLEAECVLSIGLEYSRLKGWQASKPVEFELASLHHELKGSNVPLPKALLKTLLNLVLPKVVQRSVLPAMPKELGEYMLESRRGARVSGEIVVEGPPIQALKADLRQSSVAVAAEDRSFGLARSLKSRRAPQEDGPRLHRAALGLLGIDAAHGAALGEIFMDRLAAEDKLKGPFSIVELCRFYNKFRCYPRLWQEISQAFGKALAIVLPARGISCPMIPTNNFGDWMDAFIGPLVKKRVNAKIALLDLDLSLDGDAAVAQSADYFRRTLQELYDKGAASQPIGLSEAIKNLDSWQSALTERLRVFKGQFKELVGSVAARADSETFEFGIERFRYIGPAAIRVPVDATIDQDGAFTWDIKLPNHSIRSPVFRDSTGQAYVSSPWVDSESKAGTRHPPTEEQQAGSPNSGVGEWENSRRDIQAVLALRKLSLRPADPSALLEELAVQCLGRIVVNSLALRIETNEAALRNLFISQDSGLAATTVAAMMGDTLRVDFKPVVDYVDGSERYLFQVETGLFSQAVVEAGGVSLQSDLGPADAIRIVHSIVHQVMKAWGINDQSVKSTDDSLKALHQAVDGSALSMCCSLEAQAFVEAPAGECQGKRFWVHLHGTDGKANGLLPLFVANEVDLVTLLDAIFGAPDLGI